MSGSKLSDVVIIGGGIIGLSVAWHLAVEGVSVILLERGQIGGQATGAAAGMLAPLAEAHGPGRFVDLGVASLHAYPKFVNTIRAETGMDPELVGPGMLRVALKEDEAEILCADFAWQRAGGHQVARLSGEEARRLEPALSADVLGAILSPDERHVEPKRLVRAVALAAARRGVRIVEGAQVIGLERMGSRVHGVNTVSETIDCATVVIAGGAWTGEIGRWLGASLPVSPVRGQILSLLGICPPFRHTIYGHAGYLVPKADGRIVVGATEDLAGFDARPTARGMARLLAMAPSLVPELGDLPFETAWAGLRPASPDGLPILGLVPQWENAYVASGHFRNGILLAPITGQLLARSIVGSDPELIPLAFRPDRF